MKKLIILPILAFLFVSNQMFADGKTERYAAYTPGVNGLYIENCLQPISYWGKGDIVLNAVVASDFDFLKTSSIKLVLMPGFEIVKPLSTDYNLAASTEGITFSVKKTADQSVINWKLFIHKIQKATIPYSLTFNGVNPVNTLNPNFAGWGYRVIDMRNNFPRLSGSSQSFLLAFNPSSKNDILSCNYYASNDNAQSNLTSNVEASSDGITWVNIKQFNNDVTKNSASAAEKSLSLELTEGIQYIRFQLQTKANTDPNICINFFQLKKKI